MEYVLCGMYHCRPSELKQEKLTTAMEHLVCREVENKIEKMRYDRERQEAELNG